MSSLIYERPWPDFFTSSLKCLNFKVHLNLVLNSIVGATKNIRHRNSGDVPSTPSRICEVPAMRLLGAYAVTSFQL